MVSILPLSSTEPICILLGNGDYPDQKLCNQLLQAANFIMCADGGANYAFRHDITPDLIIGDLDSIKDEALNYFIQKNTRIIKTESQQENDVEKALHEAIRLSYKQIVLIGFMGKRDDHSIATLQIVKKFKRKATIRLFSQTSEILALPAGDYGFQASSGNAISLFGFPRAYDVTTNGLKWTLNHENLFEGSRGVSNMALKDDIRISFTKGTLIVIKPFSPS